MRNLMIPEIDRYRLRGPEIVAYYGGIDDEDCGSFSLPSIIDRQPLRIVASSGEGWDHVSVSRQTRCPNWPEMCQVKDLFFHIHEWVMQLHPAKTENISNHDFCLHLWRPHSVNIPLPPSWMVGVKGMSHDEVKNAV